jgi:chromosome partitioning protein
MRGRRRGRNRLSPQDSQESDPERPDTTTGTDSDIVIETRPAPASTPPAATSTAVEPEAPAQTEPSTSASAVSRPVAPQRRIEETISDIATAHAELDNVLPPRGASTTRKPDTAKLATRSAPAGDTPVSRVATVATPSQAEGTGTEPPPASSAAGQGRRGVEPSTGGPPEPTPTPDHEGGSEPQAGSANPLPRVLAVANQKGGVGKTTTSVNLGAALAELGFRVLVIDLDPQGNATTGLGIDARNFEISMYDVLMRDSSLEDCVEPTSMKNLFVAPATIALAGAEIELVPAFSRELKLKRSIESVIDDFDYVLIDCPPSLGLITVNALAAADEVLVPIQCEYYALEGLSQLMRNVHLVASNLNPKLDISTIVLTMYDARTKLSDQVASEVRLHFGSKVCRNVIPRTVRLSEAPSFGQPITAFDPASRGSIAYRELAKEVSGGAS